MTYSFTDLGWVYCQGGGYFGGFDDGLGQGVYRGDDHVEGEVWDVSHPTQIVDEDGNAFEFDHDWAESFVRLQRGDEAGLAHFECVVIREAGLMSETVSAVRSPSSRARPAGSARPSPSASSPRAPAACSSTSRTMPVVSVASRLGDAATYVHGDVSVEDDVAAAVDAAVERYGRLDCVVNNAGILGALGPIAEIDGAAWRRTIAVLLDSVFYGTKHGAA